MDQIDSTIDKHQNNELYSDDTFYASKIYLKNDSNQNKSFNCNEINVSANLELELYDENLIYQNNEYNYEFYYSDDQILRNNDFLNQNYNSSEQQNDYLNQDNNCHLSDQQFFKKFNQNNLNLQVYDYDFHSLVNYESQIDCEYNSQNLNELNSKFSKLSINNETDNKIADLEIMEKEDKQKLNFFKITDRKNEQKINNENFNQVNEQEISTGLEIVLYNEPNEYINENYYSDELDYIEKMKENIYYDSQLNELQTDDDNQLNNKQIEDDLLKFYKDKFRNNFPELFKKKKKSIKLINMRLLNGDYIINKKDNENSKSTINNYQLNDNESTAPLDEINLDYSDNDFHLL